MGLTFDEAYKCAKENSFIESYEDIYVYNHVIDLDDVIEILEKLEEEYAPTVEMTNNDKSTFMYYIEHSTFFSLIERKHAIIDALELGLCTSGDEFSYLSDEDLMQAWLHPETIIVVDE